MQVEEFVRLLIIADKKRCPAITRKEMINGLMVELWCEARGRRGLVKRTAHKRAWQRTHLGRYGQKKASGKPRL